MSSKISTMTSTTNSSQEINKLKHAIETADAILIGAGSGLSTSAGLVYSGERFTKTFSDFIEKYHYADMYSAGFYPYQSPEEFWAYWSRHIYVNRYNRKLNTVYQNLLELVADKNYFVLTTNVDHCFQEAGFDKNRLFYTQGDYGLWQCSVPCHDKTFDNKEQVLQMVEKQKDMRIPSSLIPYCPKCGAPMTLNLRMDGSFVEDDGWRAAAERYDKFVEDNLHSNILYLELGVGNNTPAIIKYPFWQMTAQNPKATYACLNLGEEQVPTAIEERSICINADIGQTLKELDEK